MKSTDITGDFVLRPVSYNQTVVFNALNATRVEDGAKIVGRQTFANWRDEIRDFVLIDRGRPIARQQFSELFVPATATAELKFEFVCLLFLYSEWQGSISGTINRKPAKIFQNFTPENIRQQNREEIFEALFLQLIQRKDGEWYFVGRYFSLYFRQLGIHCHVDSFYKWSKDNPDLPTFDRKAHYTIDEFKQWHEFMKQKPGRKLFGH